VLVYGYATGVRSSRQLERHCRESLPYLFLTRGDAPSYRTLCTARTEQGEFLEAVWEGLFAVAAAVGLERLGRIVVDSTKVRANASPEAVLKREDFARVRAELERILTEAGEVDAREASGTVGQTELGRPVPREQMRDILRRLRRQRPPGLAQDPGRERALSAEAGKETAGEPGSSPTLPLEDLPPAEAGSNPLGAVPPRAAGEMTPQMLKRVVAGLKAIQEAEEDGRKHLCLTDPDARMMYGERHRGTREAHSFEVAVDNGLLVAGQTTQEGNDNARLEPLLEAAAKHEPDGVQAATGDCGYYGGDAVASLVARGVEVCIPDANTASDLHRGRPIGTTRSQSQGQVPFTYDAKEDVYRCPEGNVLRRQQRRQEAGQTRTVYRASTSCQGCPQAGECLRNPRTQYRTLRVGEAQEQLLAALARFAEEEVQEQYRHRGDAVETVFGFLRGALGYTRWLLRGSKKVACEGRLFKLAYQCRKVHVAWSGC
jgi:hypothetical protein